MTEEYDVFGDLDALCSDKLEDFKNTVPVAAPTQDNISDDDFVLSHDSLDASTTAGSTYTMKDSLLEGLNDVLESGSSKTKKKRGKKSMNSVKDTQPSPSYGFSTTLACLASPAKNAANAQLAWPATQDFPSPPTIEETSTLRRLTRSMRREGSSTEEPPATNEPPVVVQTLPAAVPQDVTQSKSTRGRKSNRGRKRQVQTTTENQSLQTIAENLAQAVAAFGRSLQNPIQHMYSRRQHAALMAAQSSNVAYVDLVSSPVPRIYGVIDVDADTEENNENATVSAQATAESVDTNQSLDLSFDEENPEISVKVIWNGNPETFKLRKYQKFSTMFATIAQREDTDVKNLVFNINNKILSANDTPASIDYKIFQFINGRVLVSKFNSPLINEKKKRDANKISLKIQSDQWKRPMQVELLKTEKFKILYIKCAEELNIPYENLKLSFDGESLEFDGTPADLDLEGGEAIDLRVKK